MLTHPEIAMAIARDHAQALRDERAHDFLLAQCSSREARPSQTRRVLALFGWLKFTVPAKSAPAY